MAKKPLYNFPPRLKIPKDSKHPYFPQQEHKLEIVVDNLEYTPMRLPNRPAKK